MRIPDIYVSGLGIYLPETVSVQDAIDQGLYRPDDPEDVERQGWTGTAVAGDISAPDMALRASQEALKQWGREADALDLLVYTDVWHQGPDGWQPQLYLQNHLNVGDLLAIELRHGCNGVFSSLEMAASYLMSDQSRQAALIVASDNFGTPLIDRWHSGPDFIAGDGAAAAVITREPGYAQLLSVTSTAIPQAEEMHRCGEAMFPPGATLGNHVSFKQRLEAYRNKVFTEGVGMDFGITLYEKSKECVDRALAEAGIGLGDVDRVIMTNCSREESEAQFLGVLELPLSMTTWEFTRTIGHLGAGDHLISLDHLFKTQQLAPGDRVLVVGLAPGVTYSCAVFKVLDTPYGSRATEVSA
ncbi:3-oxoacyl-[acyl-carrier-protein] synthase-3/clorobiocin biosynthesis protein CloN2 [Nonomuraea polychroma]|uniref:3-oxoacyl-[acyl-carrier-protein] synthase-3/clorobiocin biosynthesis protein CloN2 n=1 Tax=Nonomuraea polychroma TaxID=46176 RepID=A0A438LZR8_9ACTN|nr:ketoacyl-ACP synthase III family protein [Nonomuraea polychroma]RVX38738.1 3-oxoacyl-[acyl-carrier-protein] synthase-3/clorobiocin biosynthesis protein CloN2 [Nonomuraea polychroma]